MRKSKNNPDKKYDVITTALFFLIKIYMFIVIFQRIMKHTVSLNQGDFFYMNSRQMLRLSLYLHSLRRRVSFTILTKPFLLKIKFYV
jgi:hypothetical protein